MTFLDCQNCNSSPINKNLSFHYLENNRIKTEPMNSVKVFIFALMVKNVPKFISSKREASRDTERYELWKKVMNSGLTLFEVSKTDKNFEKMDKGRICAVVAYAPHIFIYFK